MPDPAFSASPTRPDTPLPFVLHPHVSPFQSAEGGALCWGFKGVPLEKVFFFS